MLPRLHAAFQFSAVAAAARARGYDAIVAHVYATREERCALICAMQCSSARWALTRACRARLIAMPRYAPRLMRAA